MAELIKNPGIRSAPVLNCLPVEIAKSEMRATGMIYENYRKVGQYSNHTVGRVCA